MKSTLEIVDIVWAILNVSDITTEITGGIYKNKRPINSDKEDLVINAIGAANTDLETALVNVNIHVPSISIKINGSEEQVNDEARLKELTKKALEILADNWGEDYNFDVQQQLLIPDESGESYINIRLDFYSINILN